MGTFGQAPLSGINRGPGNKTLPSLYPLSSLVESAWPKGSLTLIGFSTNDTIVIFDRIREIKGKTPHLTIKMVNDAINQTLSRTILTSLTAWLVVVILYILGGEGLHGFAFALVVGFLSGTYSTVYIATPILIDWVGTKTEPAKTSEKKLATAK